MTQMTTRLFAFTANVTSVTSSRVKMEILLKRVIVVKLAQKYYLLLLTSLLNILQNFFCLSDKFWFDSKKIYFL